LRRRSVRGTYLVASAFGFLFLLLVGVAVPSAVLYFLATRLWNARLALELLLAAQLVAVFVYAVFPVRRLPLDLLLNRAVTAGFAISFASLLLCLVPDWSSRRLPTFLQVVVLAILFVVLVRFLSSWSAPLQEAQPIWYRTDLRMRMSSFGVKDEIDAVVFPLLALPVALVGLISIFAAATYLLYKTGAIALLPRKGDNVTLSEARAFYLWHLVDVIPLADANRTLDWPRPALAYKGAGVGTLVLVFRVALTVPVLGAILAYAKRTRQARTRTPPPAQLDAAPGFSVWRMLDRQFGSERYESERRLWQQAVRPGDAAKSRRAMADLGVHLAERGDNEAAEHWLREAAAAGDDTGMLNLSALLLRRGASDEAEQWLRKAVAAGNEKAMPRLGIVLIDRGDRETGELWLRAADQAGIHEAAAALGVLEAESDDLTAAERHMRLAATDTEDPDIMCNLASILADKGELEEAEQWLRKAADTGEPSAMSYLANLLAESERADEAETWLRKAATTGDTEAMCDLAILLADSGRREEAKDWFRNAAADGNQQALRELTTRYNQR
jgi:TPR repeat protein